MNFDRLPGLQITQQASRQPAPLRLDGAVFVGVAPRGPSRVPVVDARWPADAGMVDSARPRQRSVAVAIDSPDAYRCRFGTVEAGAYLGRAVTAFFAQGGRRCWVMRIVSRLQPAPSSQAPSSLLQTTTGTGPLVFTARDEGAWGNTLRGRLQLQAQAAPLQHSAGRWLSLAPADTPVGTLLRWRAGPGPWALARVDGLVRERAARRDDWVLTLDSAPPAASRIELLTLEATFDDGNSREQHRALGLDPRHPRHLAAQLCRDSLLVWPGADWAALPLVPADPSVLGSESLAFAGGADDFASLQPDDFFDPLAPDGFWRDDPDPDTTGGEGIDALRTLTDIALLVVPDLYHPPGMARVPQPVEPALDDASATFAPCRPGTTPAAEPPPVPYPGLQLDPRLDADLQTIVLLQQRLVAFAQSRAGLAPLVTLLDVPPLLDARAMAGWRRHFDAEDTPDAAAYAPWLLTTSATGRLVPLPPSAVAAGIIAARELQDGLPFGPAQRVAQGIVMGLQLFAPAQADALHTDGINLFLPQPEGTVLMGARTLSRDRAWRALAARRVLHWLVRWLQREAPWLVFEPLNHQLTEEVQIWIGNLLRRLWRSGALQGHSEAEAYFVRVQAETAREAALLVEIGLALAEPLEFIVVRLRLADDGLRLAPPLFAAAATASAASTASPMAEA